MTEGTPTATLPGGGIITDETWDEFEEIATGAIGHMIEGGEEPLIFGSAVSPEDAVGLLKQWLDDHKATLIGGGVDFLKALVNRFALVDQPQDSVEEFEAGLVSMTAEQLTATSEQLADEAEALKKDVIDRRREMVAQALELGNVLVRGALATGLQAALAKL